MQNLPPSLTHLTISASYNGSFEHLPLSLTHLTIDGNYADYFYYHQPIQPLPPLSLPASLISLRLLQCKYEHSYDSLPSSLKIIEIISTQNETSKFKIFPPSLTTLSLPHNMIQNYDNLPKTLKKLVLSGNQQGPVLDFLPASLIELTLYSDFNLPILNYPSTLTKIIFGDKFNQPVDNLPPSLVYVHFGAEFDQSVDALPPRISFIHFGTKFNHPVPKLPPSLIHLLIKSQNFNNSLDDLPSTLCFLTITSNRHFNKPLNRLPDSLSNLTIHSSHFNQPLLSLPPNLTVLEIANTQIYKSNIYTIPMHHVYSSDPQTGHHFDDRLLFEFNKPVSLPASLQHAILYCRFNQSLTKLPPNLISLYLGNQYKQPLPPLPSSLHHLVIGASFTDELQLPPSLLTLGINTIGYPHPLSTPPSLTRLGLHGKYSFPIPKSRYLKVVWAPEN